MVADELQWNFQNWLRSSQDPGWLFRVMELCSASAHDDDDGCVVICRWHALYWVTASVCPLCQQRVALAARERSLSYLSEIPRFQHKSLSPRKLYGSREKWAIGYTYSTLIMKKKNMVFCFNLQNSGTERKTRDWQNKRIQVKRNEFLFESITMHGFSRRFQVSVSTSVSFFPLWRLCNKAVALERQWKTSIVLTLFTVASMVQCDL